MPFVDADANVDRNRAVGVLLNSSDLLKSRIFDKMIADNEKIEKILASVRSLIAVGYKMDDAIGLVLPMIGGLK